MRKILFTVLIGSFAFASSACAKDNSSGASTTQARESAESMPGEFVSIGNHHVSGRVEIENRPEGAVLLLKEDFMTSSGPDLRLVLRDSTGHVTMQIVSPLEQFQGAQEYALNLDAQTLSQFDEVVVYCAKFHVDFGIAKLK